MAEAMLVGIGILFVGVVLFSVYKITHVSTGGEGF